MKCHYEILGLESNCTNEDLKKAYRKLALEWHPDKNPSRLEEATEVFQLIQQAYEILSDPQERAWYDRHKDDILRGGAEEQYKDNCLDIYQYFNTSCFKGYNDDEKGFYTVYRQVFEKITAEDEPFRDDKDMEPPQFGYSDSSYEEVVHNFYAYWQSYCTAKSYSWFDKYDLSEARKSGAGRPVIRAMEKENKKLRDQHKKLRNEEIRELVAFIRKRDKRVQAAKKRMDEMKVEKAKKAEELRRKQREERRNKDMEDYKETEWSSMSQFENHFNEIESNLDATFGSCPGDTNENEEVDDLGDLYCAACEKDFRSDKAFKNHENSKKHKENVLLLKALMEEDEAMANSEAIDENSDDCPIMDSDQEENVTSEALLDELIKNSTKSKKKKKKAKASSMNNDVKETILTEVELEMENIQITETPDNDIIRTVCDEGLKNPSDSISTTEKIDVVDSELKQQNTQKTSVNSVSSKKKGKKEKVLKKENNVTETNENGIEQPSTICGTCNNNFSSRNKLFEHLKQTGHAVFKNESSSSGSGKKQRKKKL